MVKSMKDPESLWLMRKQFAIQSAASMFLTYMCCLHGRSPSRFQISRKTGGMYMSEILPGAHQTTPFGLTPVANRTATSAGSPNMQHFITKTGVEGIVTAVLTALSKSLTLPEFDLSGTLTIFLRDEVSNQALEMQETELITKNRSSFGRVHTSKVLGLIHPALLWCTRMLRSSFDVQRQLVSSARTKTGYVQRSFTR
jgi:phosphatidylinositol kinase/protein kinase (PI-3  family)